ncbi:MAG: TonB C-terminal domain-containing protein [Ahrensia sp.]|nr:TonB C-terminal domain-containing protein [Ahrensia sp.]
MRAGLATSFTLHALILGWGLVNLSAPEQFDVNDVEALPIELVTIQELTQIQEGAQDAPKDGPAAVAPTTPPKPDPAAVNAGNKERDQQTPETQVQKAVAVEEARLPDPSTIPVPRPAPREEPKPIVEQKPEPKPESTPATEVAPKPAPKQEVKPDPISEAIATAAPPPTPVPTPTPEAAPQEQFVSLPDQLPTPQARPQPPKPAEVKVAENAPAQTAKTPERKKEESQQSKSAAQKEETKEKADEVASLLNREAGSGGGSKATNKKASAGGKKTTGGNTLTTSEMDSLRGQIQACWSVPASAQGEVGLKVSVQFQLNQNAKLEGSPKVTTSSGNRQLDESARRAVARCGAQGFQLPTDKYDSWRDVVVNFDPSEMFR